MSRGRATALAGALVFASAFASAAAASAEVTPELDVHIQEDRSPRVRNNDLQVFFRVTLTDRRSGAQAGADYELFALARNAQGEQTTAFECEQLIINDPDIGRGEYYCPVIVDHGGRWTVVALVHRKRLDPKEAPVKLTEAEAAFDIQTNAVYSGNKGPRIQGRAGEVVILWAHAAAAVFWFGCVALLAGLAVPGLRRKLSSPTIHHLERRLDLLVRVSWGVTFATVASGTYLLLNQTAYQTPFSRAAVDGVFTLPYGKPYFLALAAKLALYFFMMLAVVPLVGEARRQLRLGLSSSGAAATRPIRRSRAEDAIWGSAPTLGSRSVSTGALVVTPPATEDEGESGRSEEPAVVRLTPRVAALVVVAGGVGISVCVTLLKYFHELVEAVRT